MITKLSVTILSNRGNHHITVILNFFYIIDSVDIGANTKWVENAITIAGGYGNGNRLNQFCTPYGLCVDNEQTVYIADSRNHRILEWKSNAREGRVVAGGNGEGSHNDQLSCPTDVILDKENDCLVIRRADTSREIIISDVYCYGLAMDTSMCLI